MEYKALVLEKKDGVAVLTLNQPESMNSLVQQIWDELSVAAVELENDEEVKVVVITGAGKAFCAGGDLKRFLKGFTQRTAVDYVENVQKTVSAWINFQKPTIAAVNGAAVGAGLSLMMMCDLSVAADTAKFSAGFINMGLVPDCGAGYYLPRCVGIQKAKELIYTGKTIDATEAEKIGLVNQVVVKDELMNTVMAMAERLAKGPSFALQLAKRMVNMSYDMDLKNFFSLEAAQQSICFLTEDSKEAVTAFVEKRKPVFKGE